MELPVCVSDELFSTEAPQVISEEGKLKGSTRRIQVVPPQAQQRHSFSQQKRGEHARITFGTEEGAPAINRKKSVLERLGKRPSDSAVSETENFLKRTKISSDTHKNEGGRSVSVVKPDLMFINCVGFIFVCFQERFKSSRSTVEGADTREAAGRGIGTTTTTITTKRRAQCYQGETESDSSWYQAGK